jgi:acyl carrier protein
MIETTCRDQPSVVRNIERELLEVLSRRFPERPMSNCSASTSLFDVGGLSFDSLDAFELVVTIESHFEVRIGELDLYERRSIGGVAALIEEQLKNPSRSSADSE